MSGTVRKARVTARDSFPVGDHRVEVLQAEGAVQLVLVLDGFPAGPLRLANVFTSPATADELQAVVDHLRGLA